MPKTEMLINYVPGEECRIAIVEDGRLEEFYQERASSESHVSNIYKGRVTNVEPAIQAAFVDFGLERNGFLHITDLHPKYFPGKDREEFEKVGHKTARHERPPIQRCLKRGQEILVQVIKEGIGTKGPTVTSYLSIPGRFLVMMPDMTRLGVSRKVEDDDARAEMRDILKTLDPPKEFGFIVRTAGIGQTKTDLKRDLAYLLRLWKNIDRRRKETKRVGELYAESDLVIRTIRDVFNNDIDRIVCDDMSAAVRARDFLAVANPRSKSKVVYYDDPVPLFHRMGVEEQLDHMDAREVPLPSGGALVIDQAEALVAIDINSGKSRAARDAESNAFNTNMEAVDEIARQLRLRDLGGLIVLDLIDMRPMKNRKTVETRFRNNLKKDRARTRIGMISQFGLLEMTRQRMRPSLVKSTYTECIQCAGRGHSKSPESVVLGVMRRLALVMHRPDVARIELTISPDVAFHILNRKRAELVNLEIKHGKPVMVRVGGGTVDFVNVAAFNDRGITLPAELDLRKLRPADENTFRELDEGDLAFLDDEVDGDEAEAVEAAADLGDELDADIAEADADEDGEPVHLGRDPSEVAHDDHHDEHDANHLAARLASRPLSREAAQHRQQARAGIAGEAETSAPPQATGEGGGRKRRRRRRGGRGRGDGQDQPQGPEDAAEHDHSHDHDDETVVREGDGGDRPPEGADGVDGPRKKKRRRRRRGRGNREGESGDETRRDASSVGDSHHDESDAHDDEDENEQASPPLLADADADADTDADVDDDSQTMAGDVKPTPSGGPQRGSQPATGEDTSGVKKKRRRRGRGKKSDESGEVPPQSAPPSNRGPKPAPKAPPTRGPQRTPPKPRVPLPRDEFGDVNGNIKPEAIPAATAKPATTPVTTSVPVPGSAAAATPRPPLKPGRGYANRMVNR